ncbi:GlsB/YeaQ/YmgE family stress response membrane protein [Myxosarcina sp. GI1]|uniref:GlsB/YeaQ/YmgE family stress response membrane protein n=1 Tax=Myxosarcina sp. GI1 TaxID=1541065 RepID=UPI00055EA518|nr:transglycosylase [Myxosarcina sp. GI1]
MNLLSWLCLGLIAGVIAKFIAPNTNTGVTIGSLMFGIIGAFSGGSFAIFYLTGHLVLTTNHFSILGVSLAILGASVAVFLWQVIIRSSYS